MLILWCFISVVIFAWKIFILFPHFTLILSHIIYFFLAFFGIVWFAILMLSQSCFKLEWKETIFIFYIILFFSLVCLFVNVQNRDEKGDESILCWFLFFWKWEWGLRHLNFRKYYWKIAFPIPVEKEKKEKKILN